MADFYDICKRVYAIFLRSGYPGIEAVGETKDAWIISPVPEELGRIEYGTNIYIIDKKTGDIRLFDFFDDNDRNIYCTATKVDVPEDLLG